MGEATKIKSSMEHSSALRSGESPKNIYEEIGQVRAERDRLSALNRELVEALQQIRSHTIGENAPNGLDTYENALIRRINACEDIARALLAKCHE